MDDFKDANQHKIIFENELKDLRSLTNLKIFPLLHDNHTGGWNVQLLKDNQFFAGFETYSEARKAVRLLKVGFTEGILYQEKEMEKTEKKEENPKVKIFNIFKNVLNEAVTRACNITNDDEYLIVNDKRVLPGTNIIEISSISEAGDIIWVEAQIPMYIRLRLPNKTGV